MSRSHPVQPDPLKRAIEERDLPAIGRQVDFLRFRRRLKFAEIHELAHELTGISLAEWDELMGELDREASR